MPTINKPKKKRTYNNSPDSTRKKRQSVYNTNRWRELRTAKLMNEPRCEVCLMQDRVRLAEDIHHLVSFLDVPEEQMLQYAFDYNNLCSVCRECHNRIHNGDLAGCQSLEAIKMRLEKLMFNN